jgi:hypothetical protein
LTPGWFQLLLALAFSLTGHVLAREDWEIVRLPAIAEEDERLLVERAGSGPTTDAGIWHLYKQRAEALRNSPSAGPEPLSVMAKRLGLLLW